MRLACQKLESRDYDKLTESRLPPKQFWWTILIDALEERLSSDGGKLIRRDNARLVVSKKEVDLRASVSIADLLAVFFRDEEKALESSLQRERDLERKEHEARLHEQDMNYKSALRKWEAEEM